jgi:hypothetical protein
VFPLILLGAGAALKFIGGIISGKGAKEAGRLEQERLNFNADIADLQAADAEQRGVEAVSNQRAATRQVIGTQRAGYAAQNVDVHVGSAVDVAADAALLGELDAQTIQRNAEREAWGYRAQAVDRRMAGNVARQSGNSQGNAAYFGAAGTLISDASLLADKYGPKPKPKA